MNVSSCASSEEPESESVVQEILDYSLDTQGEYISIESDNVSMASYDAKTETMEVIFDNGMAYWYRPVKQDIWNDFYNAQPHPWSQVGYPMLVKSGITYGKLN